MKTTASLLGALALAAFAGCAHAVPVAKAPAASAAARAAAPDFGPRDVDAMLEKTWRERGVTPAAPADDATFLRRAFVDIVGTIPPPERVVSFLADRSPDKRARLVDDLLASPEYAEHWADYWEDELMGQARAADIDRFAFRLWLRDAFAKNTPWDRVAYALLTATGQNAPGGERPKSMRDDERAIERSPEPINGAVDWVLEYRDTPQDWAGSASRTFLGLQIQCAQCHDHKTEKWTQKDFRQLTACFMRAQTLPLDGPMTKGVKRALVRDIDRPLPRFLRDPDLGPMARAQPVALDGTPMEGNPREAIAKWITTNPAFAVEAVNRMWGLFLGRGFVDPVDDIRPSNPADAPELEQALARDFAAHGYDSKRLIRTIALSRAYGLSTSAPDESKPPVAWSRFRATPLGPNEMLDALIAATGLDGALHRMGRRDVDALTERLRQLYGFVFDVDEASDKPSFEGTITQALVQLNGRLVAGGSTALPGTALERIARSDLTDAKKIEALYLRTVSRLPSSEELEGWTRYLAAPPPVSPGETRRRQGPGPFAQVRETRDPKIAALEDVMWTLLNSSEFVLNH